MVNSAEKRARWARRLCWVALVLAVIVVAASSYLRLAGNGLGCDPWPDCYGTPTALKQSNDSTLTQVVRLTHRVTASAFLVVAIVALGLGWSSWQRNQRLQGALLVFVALVLAVVGRLTPSSLPWITWVNVLGGFALIALALGLALSIRAGRAQGTLLPHARGWTILLVVLLVAQVAGGTLLSVRLAMAECQPVCIYAPGGDLLALWGPDRAGAAAAVAGDPGGATLLHAWHRLGGVVLGLVVLGFIACARDGSRRSLGVVAGLAVLALGYAATHLANAPVGAMHAIAAAFLLAFVVLRDPGRAA